MLDNPDKWRKANLDKERGRRREWRKANPDMREPTNEPPPIVDPVNEAQQTGALMEPWDKEFNAAILHLASAGLPRYFGTMRLEAWAKLTAWEWYDAENRPIVPLIDFGTMNNVFADPEIEMAFAALVIHYTLRPDVIHAHHKPHICPEMTLRAADKISDLIVDSYGDEPRTRRWRQAVYFLTAGQLAFRLLYRQAPTDLREYLTKLLSGATLVGENVYETRASVHAMLAQVALAIVQHQAQEAHDTQAAARELKTDKPTLN